MYKYEKIIKYITDSVETGNLNYGEKIPSLRFMSDKFGCNLSVVMQAYSNLESLGVIYSVEKSGYFISPPGLNPIPTLDGEIYSLKKEEAKPLSIIGNIVEASNDKSIAPLGAGIPDSTILPIKDIQKSISRVLRNTPEVLYGYSNEAGSFKLRQEISRVLLNRGITAKPDDILITNGCIEALSLAIQAISYPGDTIAIESPIFMGTIQLLKELKRNIITIPTSPDLGIDIDALKKTIEKEDIKGVILTSLYQNPLGYIMPVENRKEISKISRDYSIPIIEDDLYSDCSHLNSLENPIKSFDENGSVIYCSSFSKTVSPGLRIGWVVGGKYHKRCKGYKVSSTLGGNNLLQEALADFLHSNGYYNHVKKLQRNIAKQAAEMKVLLEEFLPKDVAISTPKGGLFYWIELRKDIDVICIYNECLNNKISIVPGQAFSSGERFTNCFRLSFGNPVTPFIVSAIKKLGEIIYGYY
ncbi:MAG: PLP-dependent aminotransferase family protein [Spirochaetales bacterium]|nr:PLP-dependent aminotransferase family protein [Spirochaetales bacterium]